MNMPAENVTRDEILTVIRNNMTKVLEEADGKEIPETASMKDFGADSLEIVEVVSRSMKELRVKVPRTELSRARNIKELVDIFGQHAAA